MLKSFLREKDFARKNLDKTRPQLIKGVGVRTVLAEAYHIPSGSMEPTPLVGDWLLVNKLRFGPHIPFTKLRLPGYAELKRSDVDVFVSPPQDPSIRISPDEITPTLIKRVAGVAGDTLLMLDRGTSSCWETIATTRLTAATMVLYRWRMSAARRCWSTTRTTRRTVSTTFAL